MSQATKELINAAAPSGPRSSSRPTYSVMHRAGVYFAAKGWAHVILLSGVGIFMFPFLWMVGMSLKTDEESAQKTMMPEIPVFRAASPFVREAPRPEKPMDVPDDRWKQMLPLLVDRTGKTVDAAALPAGGQFVDSGELRRSATTLLAGRLVNKLDTRLWSGTDAALFAAYDKLLAASADVSTALVDSLGRLELHGLQLSTLDSQLFNLSPGPEIAKTWKIESGPGELEVAGEDASYLHYHFDSPNSPPVVLRYDFDFPVDPAELHNLILAMNPDDSWHQLNATLDLNGTHWESTMTTYICQYRPGSILFQPPGFDDTTLQARIWIPLRSPAGDTARPQPLPAGQKPPVKATLRIIIKPSSTMAAIWGKIQRNYTRAFYAVPFWTYLGNSLILVVLQILGALFSTSFVAYAFARLNWPGRSLAFGILLATMMLPGQVTMIPGFLIWRKLGWYNTLNPLWVGAWFGSTFFIFLMVQHMKTIPKELEEAARLDGLNAVQIWWYVILPQVKPVLAAIAIMVFQGAWNDFMGPLIMIRDQARFPLSLGLFNIQLEHGGDWSMIMAGNMLMTIPVILIFFFFQRYFIEGATLTGMKG